MLDCTEAVLLAYIVDIRKGANRNRNLLPGGDDSFLVVAREDRWTRKDFELICRFKQMHYGCESVARRHVNIGSITYVLNDLAEIDQIGRIENIGSYRRTPSDRRRRRIGNGNVNRIIIAIEYGLLREVPTNRLLYFAK